MRVRPKEVADKKAIKARLSNFFNFFCDFPVALGRVNSAISNHVRP